MRRLFEAWKRALDATIEVPDRELQSMLCRRYRRRCAVEREHERDRDREGGGEDGRREGERIEREDREGRIEKRERYEGCEDYRGKGWLCLPVKAPGG